jgi:hypothetical protein
MSTKIKLLIMGLIYLGADWLTKNGWPVDPTTWTVFGLTLVGMLLVYIPKNIWWPSESAAGKLSFPDIIGGLCIAVGTGLSNFLASWALGSVFSWPDVLKLCGIIAGTYLLTLVRGSGEVKIAA